MIHYLWLRLGVLGLCGYMQGMLIIAILLLLIFGGLGFTAHVLWWGLILAAVLAVAHFFTGDRL